MRAAARVCDWSSCAAALILVDVVSARTHAHFRRHAAMAGSPEAAGDADVLLRRKLEDTERRLQSTSRELMAALSKLHEGGSRTAGIPRGDGGTAGTGGGPPRGSGGGAGGMRRGGGSKLALCQPCACGHTGMSCMEHAGSSFWRSFVLAYMCRAGIAVFARGRP